MIELTGTHIMLVGLITTVVMGIVGGVKWLTTAITAVRDDARKEMHSLRELMDAQLGKITESEGKARHTMANSVATQIAEVKVEVGRLQRETVRREEMVQLEARIVAGQAKIESKLDGLAEKTIKVMALEERIALVAERVETLIERIDHGSNRPAR